VAATQWSGIASGLTIFIMQYYLFTYLHEYPHDQKRVLQPIYRRSAAKYNQISFGGCIMERKRMMKPDEALSIIGSHAA